MIETLKMVDIDKLSNEELLEHKTKILNLEEDLIIEYLKYAIDNYYKTEEDGNNSEKVELFFKSQEFQNFYTIILNSEAEIE